MHTNIIIYVYTFYLCKCISLLFHLFVMFVLLFVSKINFLFLFLFLFIASVEFVFPVDAHLGQ